MVHKSGGLNGLPKVHLKVFLDTWSRSFCKESCPRKKKIQVYIFPNILKILYF